MPDPEDDGVDVMAFAELHARDEGAAARADQRAGRRRASSLFKQVGCATCHVAVDHDGAAGHAHQRRRAARARRALGNKIIHPYSDFLLHDIGTGDGIPVLPTPEFASTANQIRTAPLWALRTRNRLMHDGLSFTKQEAIARHAGQATAVRQAYDALTAAQKAPVLAFLDSL